MALVTAHSAPVVPASPIPFTPSGLNGDGVAQAGWQVGLVDPADEQARASFGNAGQICPELSEPLASWGTMKGAFRRLYAFGGPLDFRLSDIGLWGPWALRGSDGG